MVRWVLLIIITSFVSTIQAQYLQNYCKVWYFGTNAGLSFSTPVPTPLSNSVLSTTEGCMTLSNYDELYLYTDGSTIYNKAHQPMPNGTGLMGHASAAQSALAIPVPGFADRFVVFTVDANENDLANGFRYSLINMNLDNGKGDVTALKNVLIEDLVTEKLTVIPHENNIDYWVIVHDWENNHFLSYLLTTTGLSASPVVSAIGSSYNYGPPSGTGCTCGEAVGFLKGSPDGNLIATCIHGSAKVELFDFDRNSGELSNLRSLSTPAWPYGIEFSPNSEKLYVTSIYSNSKLIQFDLSGGTPTSYTTVYTASGFDLSALVLACDGKIYVAEYDSPALHTIGVINSPDNAGTACNFVPHGQSLGNGYSQRGLPNMYFFHSPASVKPEKSDWFMVDVFPNPVQPLSDFLIDGLLPGMVEISWVTPEGRIVWSQKEDIANSSILVKTPNLINGVYILRLNNKNQSINKKVVINSY